MLDLSAANENGMVRAAQIRQARDADTKELAGKAANLKKIDASAKDFEASFVTEMIKPMFEGIKSDPMFGGGQSETIFNGMLQTQYGKLIAERGGLGIADQIKGELLRLQEVQNHASA